MAELTREHGGLAHLTVELAGGETIRRETAEPFQELASLADREVRPLRVDPPDLETVFLNLTGRSLRDP